MSLREYRRKRNFKKTSEPNGKALTPTKKLKFVVQKHKSRSLHYDFRLQIGSKMASWAVPKGISKKVGEKRLAVKTEDHPLEYATFEGTIPEGEYGAGTVKIWDKGFYYSLKKESIRTSIRKGKIEVYLKGDRYKGAFALIHFKENNWLILKMKKRV